MKGIKVYLLILGAIIVVTVAVKAFYSQKTLLQKVKIDKPATLQKKSFSPPFTLTSETSDKPIQPVKEDKADDLQEITDILGQFDIPSELRKEIIDSASKNEIQKEWTQGQASQEELRQTGLTTQQIFHSTLNRETQNLKAGFGVESDAFAELQAAALPTAEDDAQTREIKSRVLSDLGFAAAGELNHKQAEEAFKSVIENYPETQSAPTVYLEYSRLLLEQERLDEAKDIVDDAIYAYGDDDEYAVIAKDLRALIYEHE